MPMILRDGSFYSPFESQHMILRDGKTVHSYQASVFNRLLRSPFGLWNPFRSYQNSNNDYVPDEEIDSYDGSSASNNSIVSSSASNNSYGGPTSRNNSHSDPSARNNSYGGPASRNNSHIDPSARNYSYGGSTSRNNSQSGPSARNNSYGGPTSRNSSLSGPLAPIDSYGESSLSENSHSDPSARNNSYGGPTSRNNSYSDPSARNNSYGGSSTRNNSYGGPSTRNNSYGGSSASNNSCDDLPVSNNSYDDPPVSNNSYGGLTTRNSSHSGPSTRNNSYGGPSTRNNSYGGPSTRNNSYGCSSASNKSNDDLPVSNNSYGGLTTRNNSHSGPSTRNNSYGGPSTRNNSLNPPPSDNTYSSPSTLRRSPRNKSRSGSSGSNNSSGGPLAPIDSYGGPSLSENSHSDPSVPIDSCGGPLESTPANSQASGINDYLPNFLKRKITMPLIKSFSDIHQANDAQPDAQTLSSKPSQSMYACYSEKSPASKPGVRKSPRTTALPKQYGEMDNGKPQQTLASKYPYALTVLMIFAYKFFIASTDVMIKVEKHLKIYLKIALHYFYRFQSRAQKTLHPYFVKLIQYARKRGFNLNGIRKKYLTLNMIVFVLPFVLGVMLLGGYQYSRMQIDDIGSMIPNSIKMNIPAKENVTFWHVPPSAQTYEGSIAENLNDGNNIVIHLRDEAFGNSYHRTNVFKVLSDAGFHVIIPNEPIQETDFLSLWTGVKVLLDKNQDMYIWSDIQNVGHTTPYVDLLTQSSLYPKGVIIESTVRDNFDSVRNLEIWKATTKNGYLSNAPTLNYLKCPLTTPSYKLNHLREEIALCINTVSFNADFKMRQ